MLYNACLKHIFGFGSAIMLFLTVYLAMYAHVSPICFFLANTCPITLTYSVRLNHYFSQLYKVLSPTKGPSTLLLPSLLLTYFMLHISRSMLLVLLIFLFSRIAWITFLTISYLSHPFFVLLGIT